MKTFQQLKEESEREEKEKQGKMKWIDPLEGTFVVYGRDTREEEEEEQYLKTPVGRYDPYFEFSMSKPILEVDLDKDESETGSDSVSEISQLSPVVCRSRKVEKETTDPEKLEKTSRSPLGTCVNEKGTSVCSPLSARGGGDLSGKESTIGITPVFLTREDLEESDRIDLEKSLALAAVVVDSSQMQAPKELESDDGGNSTVSSLESTSGMWVGSLKDNRWDIYKE